MTWKVVVEGGNIEFNSAHFITFAGECEPLHGHNYGVRVEAEGPLTPERYVIDFLVLKDIARTLAKAWDHRFLLPLHNPHLRVSEQNGMWEIAYVGPEAADFLARTGPIRYVMPAWSVVPLPIDNTTAERLAELFAHRLAAELRARGTGEQLTRLIVGIAETPMQSAYYTLELPAPACEGASP